MKTLIVLIGLLLPGVVLAETTYLRLDGGFGPQTFNPTGGTPASLLAEQSPFTFVDLGDIQVSALGDATFNVRPEDNEVDVTVSALGGLRFSVPGGSEIVHFDATLMNQSRGHYFYSDEDGDILTGNFHNHLVLVGDLDRFDILYDAQPFTIRFNAIAIHPGNVVPVPLPSTAGLMLSGLGCLVVFGMRARLRGV